MIMNRRGEHMVEHHVKYKEIHGVDETVWMTRSEHALLHLRLRRENKCEISPEEMRVISNRAGSRTGKAKISTQEWCLKNRDQRKNREKRAI